jgi:hypothetical protein
MVNQENAEENIFLRTLENIVQISTVKYQVANQITIKILSY